MGLAAVAAIGAVGAIGGGLIAKSASDHASNVAQQTATANNALQKQIYDQNTALEQPAIDRGNQAGDALQGFLGLGGDPAKTQAAFNNYLNSTGYQFTRQQGIDAAEQSASAQGLLNSGGALKALQDRGTGLAQQYGQQYVGNLDSVANRGTSATNALAGVGTGYANAVGGNNNNAATVSGNAGIAAAGQMNGLIGNAFSAFGSLRGTSSFGGGGAGGGLANAFAQQANSSYLTPGTSAATGYSGAI